MNQTECRRSIAGRMPLTAAIAGLCALLFTAAAAGARTVNEGIRDPYFQEVVFYELIADPLSALAKLQAAGRQHRLQVDLGAVDLELGKLYSEYHLPQMAADSYARVMGAGTAASLRSEASYRLAQYYYQRGDYARASSALSQATTGLPYALESQKPFFKSMILMATGRNDEAIEVFGEWKSPLQYDPFTRYNIGVALMRKGDLLAGAGFLDSVGVMAADTGELLSLRDQANLALGYGFMRADQGATARPLLKRVRLDGPYSNRALLGAGWAELAPDGQQQQNLFLSPIACKEDPSHMLPQIPILHRPGRDACDPDRIFKQRVNFENVRGGKSEAARLRRALTPWLVLVQRSPAADPSVQEALLAVPYAYQRLKQGDKAVDYYRQAVLAYETERDALERLTEVVRTGPIHVSTPLTTVQDISWQTVLWPLPRPEDVRYLQTLFSGYALQAALEDYRDLLDLQQNLTLSAARLQRVAQSMTPASPETPAVEQQPQPLPPAVTDESQPSLDLGLDNSLLLGALTPSSTAPAGSAAATGSPQLRSDRLNERYAALQGKLAILQADAGTALNKQEQVVRELALAELEAHHRRLETYLAQARIALARLLDPASGQDHP